MFIDISGKTKLKIGIIILANLDKSIYQKEKIDQKISELAAEYAKAGYDAICPAMPYNYIDECELCGIKVLPCCLYTFGDALDENERFSVVGIGMSEPHEISPDWRNMQKTAYSKAGEAIRLIEKNNGISIAIFPRGEEIEREKLERLTGADMLDATSMSHTNFSMFSDSGRYPSIVICNKNMPRASLIVESTSFDNNSIMRALRAQKFYSTTGPELHLEQVSADKIKINCTAAEKISFYSSTSAPAVEVFDNNTYIEADYAVKSDDKFITVSIFDAERRFAVSATCMTEKWYKNK